MSKNLLTWITKKDTDGTRISVSGDYKIEHRSTWTADKFKYNLLGTGRHVSFAELKDAKAFAQRHADGEAVTGKFYGANPGL